MFNNPYNSFFNNNPYGQGFNNQYPQQNYTQMPQQQMAQSQQQIQSPQQQTNAVNTNKIFVNGIEDVKSRIQPPNSDILYLDNDKALLYQKIVNATGQFTVKTFSITDYIENQQSQAKEVDMSAYVLKSDFESLELQIKNLEAKLEAKSDKFDSKKNEIISIPEVKK